MQSRASLDQLQEYSLLWKEEKRKGILLGKHEKKQFHLMVKVSYREGAVFFTFTATWETCRMEMMKIWKCWQACVNKPKLCWQDYWSCLINSFFANIYPEISTVTGKQPPAQEAELQSPPWGRKSPSFHGPCGRGRGSHLLLPLSAVLERGEVSLNFAFFYYFLLREQELLTRCAPCPAFHTAQAGTGRTFLPSRGCGWCSLAVSMWALCWKQVWHWPTAGSVMWREWICTWLANYGWFLGVL